MKIEDFSFGKIQIDGKVYDHDVVISHGKIRKRHKGPSKELKGRYGHTPLTNDEDIPWDCERLIIGTGANGSLPVVDEVLEEARERKIKLVMLPTKDAIEAVNSSQARTNAILHITC